MTNFMPLINYFKNDERKYPQYSNGTSPDMDGAHESHARPGSVRQTAKYVYFFFFSFLNAANPISLLYVLGTENNLES